MITLGAVVDVAPPVAGIAQSVEQLICNHQVVGSSPSSSYMVVVPLDANDIVRCLERDKRGIFHNETPFEKTARKDGQYTFVAQLVRAPSLHGGCHRFKPCREYCFDTQCFCLVFFRT